jgi:CHAD domain-containing protein
MLEQLARRVRDAEKSPDDPEVVHDLRVAIRRFSQAVRIFPEMFEPSFEKRVRRQLKKVMGNLGALRNRDIAEEILEAANVVPDEALLKDMRKVRRDALKRLSGQLRSWRKRDLLREWKEKMQPSAGGARALENARLELAGLAGELFQAGDYAVRHRVPYRLLHKFRLLAKRLRYSLEMFQLNRSRRFRSRFKELKNLQDQLGAVNDCVTVIELMNGHAIAIRRLRLLRAEREKSFRSYWNQNFDSQAQDWWLKALIPQKGGRT